MQWIRAFETVVAQYGHERIDPDNGGVPENMYVHPQNPPLVITGHDATLDAVGGTSCSCVLKPTAQWPSVPGRVAMIVGCVGA